MKRLYTICYVSKASENTTNDDIKDIFKVTEKANNATGISGILLHSFDNFFQVLEGEKRVLEQLYEDKIKRDTRHSNIYEVFNRDMETPIFSTYLSQFLTITTSIQLDDIRKYLNANRTNSISEKLSRLLKPFMIFDE
ncbi:sensor of blue-light using FAD [Aequorivita sublithincola DSM 14238]|uniref:Sensor of blue-light using FAD n=1 Tax=Aequorivita sublithincola (strain DSM 14238 / LMG 21431 / ACAM 643 / 9-3) TaxID=746697 RepID=I3YX71_AEQSU|nr:BLUF domain-containing protein [Aequorivita sublithincola]AFL81589.1 sensor of blue-light using FAD [Aequorivita sublithincola DSM 14238]